MTYSLTPSSIQSFQKHIFSWWEKNRRDLPWRQTHDPYKILVSEVMLQQTQVSRVLPKYEEFIRTYPTVTSLAETNTSDVLKIWKGLGYNRRALYLKRTAVEIVSAYDSAFPKSEAELVELPGLGIYTARAILVFAYKYDVAMIDTNIRQIIVHHFYNGQSQKESIIQHTADTILPKAKAWEWHQALMDYGAIVRIRNTRRTPHARKKVKPFRNTKRFYRGRIVDILREQVVHEDVLRQELKAKYKVEDSYHDGIIQDLLADGLIERTNRGKIRLPV